MKLDVTNRQFLADLTRAQLLALTVQKQSTTLAQARECSDEVLRASLEVTPKLQQEVRA